MVTAVKNRNSLLTKDTEECVREALKGISERYEILIDEMGFDQNHVPILCGVSPSLSPLRIIGIIKSITERKVFENFPKFKKKELWGGEFWSYGKYIGTVREASSEKVIRPYIKNQSIDNKEKESRLKQLKLFNI